MAKKTKATTTDKAVKSKTKAAKKTTKTVAKKAAKKTTKTVAKKAAKKTAKKAVPKPKKAAKTVAKTPKPAAKAVAKPAKKPEPKPVEKPVAAPAAAPATPAPSAAPTGHRPHHGAPIYPRPPIGKPIDFKPDDFVVYPTHGVGKVTDVETRTVAGHELKLFVIEFERDRMTLRVPVAKAHTSGLRRLSTRKMIDKALTTLKGRARTKRTMWSRRAQEYEAKINSGDPISIAEVVRDLHRNTGQPDQSFSERQIYESARDRLALELGAIEKVDIEKATEKMEEILSGSNLPKTETVKGPA
jgi:CarD family transcriptional regulator